MTTLELAPRDLLVAEPRPEAAPDSLPPRREWSPERLQARREERERGNSRERDAIREQVRAVRRAQLPLVRAVHEAYETGRIHDACEGSMAVYAFHRGLSSREAYLAAQAGHLFRHVAGTEALFLDAVLTMEAAGLLGQLHLEEGGLPTDDDWVAMACTLTSPDFRERLEARREERAQGAPVKKFECRITHAATREFARARVLASRKARRHLTKGEAFAHIVSDYLDRHDPMRRTGRRPGRTVRGSLVGDTIPQAEKDLCRRRFGDRCAVNGCTHRAFLDFAHIKARALGGANRHWNLLLLCRNHHRMFDSKRMFLVGPAGGPQWFEDRRGRKVADLRPPPAPDAPAYAPRAGPG